MKYIKLSNEVMMPIMGLGTWQSAAGEVYQAVRWALKLGYRMFDCAAVYGNQAEIGQAFSDAIREDGIKREELFVISKLWNDAHQVEDVQPALKQTLKDLQLEYLDLYLIHWPVAQKKGTIIPEKAADFISPEELPLDITWAEMEKIYNNGQVKAIGVSNLSQTKLQDLAAKVEIMPMVNQIEIHPLLQQEELVKWGAKNNIVTMAYSPLGSAKAGDKKTILHNVVIEDIAKRVNATPAQVVLSWEMSRGLIVIPKSVHEEHLRENFAAQNVELDKEDIAKINALDEGYRFVDGEVFSMPGSGYENLWM